MIGALKKPNPPVLKPRPVPKIVDVVGDRANSYGHIAREPNTNYDIRLMHYHQRKKEYEDAYANSMKKRMEDEKIEAKYMTHAVKKGFQQELKHRVDKKLVQYDQNIVERRNKISDLIAKEERAFLREVVDEAQKATEQNLQEKIKKLHEIKTRNEEERLAVVKKKRLQQYLSRCSEYRPVVANQRLRETKQVQRLQIKENEKKRMSEAELEHFWHEMKLKYCATIAEREEQDRLNKKKRDFEMKTFTDLQIQRKLDEEQMRKQEIIEDGIRLQQLKNDLEEEERAYLEKKHKTKADLLQTTQAQIKQRRDMLKRVADAEKEIQRAYDKLADDEIEREQEKIKSKVSTGYQDMIQYQNYLADLKRQREEQDRYKEQVLEETMKNIQRKEEDKKCQAAIAKRALFEEVLKGRDQQIEERKVHEEELRKAKDLEFESRKASLEQNDRLRREYEHQKLLSQKKYSEDLKQQMAYSKVLEEREKANMKKILDAAVVENQIYDTIVAKVLSGNIKISETHPFKYVVDTEKCPCPKPNY